MRCVIGRCRGAASRARRLARLSRHACNVTTNGIVASELLAGRLDVLGASDLERSRHASESGHIDTVA